MQHHDNMRDLNRMAEEQVNDTVFDAADYLEQSFSTTYATTLSAKIVGQKKDSNNSEILMYIACAIASLVAVVLQARIACTKPKKTWPPIVEHDIYQRLV